ncbi:MAG: nitroreductase family protein, partial [Deltaproteobacteria bacterium]|nr:nitroreductase family protein [Deltaproteobacteria bacterium]
MILELMQKRRSIRRFKPEVPPDAAILKLIEAAVAAPSATNKQPWRFLIAKKKKHFEIIVKAVEKARQNYLSLLNPEYRSEFAQYSVNFMNFQNAPVIILPIYRAFQGISALVKEKSPEKEAVFLRTYEHNTALMGVSLAVQNILLMSEAIGLGACCMTGPLIARVEIEKCLLVRKGWQIAALIAVGYPDEAPEH